ncbi:hypothetical protein HK098_003751 [Nowakowskiella sp. JEL0407]|nr:hypothetical protein HK098_003751 [Nowakowskiella sp. JEL0407]
MKFREYARNRIREDFRAGNIGGGFRKEVEWKEESARLAKLEKKRDAELLERDAVKARGFLDRIVVEGDQYLQLKAAKEELEALRNIVNGVYEKEFEIPKSSPLYQSLPTKDTFQLLDTDAQEEIANTSTATHFAEYVKSQLRRL